MEKTKLENIEPVSITPRAAEEIRKIMETKNIPRDYGLRIGIKGGGCGAQLIIGFDKRKEMDALYTLSDIPVYIDKRHTLYVMGKVIDFHEDAEARGFTFSDSPVK
jgi:iron-sulfur cluster assembly protein